MPLGYTSATDTQSPSVDYDMIKDSQKAIAEALERWSSAFSQAGGKPPVRFPLQPLPPKEVVETAFDFVERMVAAQKELVLALFDTAA